MPQTLPSVKSSLVIVESPAKCNKIEQFLGPGYKCIATFGHIQELKDLKDIDISNKFTPSFTPAPSKSQQIAKLRKAIRESKEVLIATDDDREGEGIAWHVCSLFKLPFTTKRIIFHEITKPAILNAVRNPGVINMELVAAQQSRQILDLIVGFRISPVLWQNITQKSSHGLSAGRCQTPALRIIYDNECDIANAPGKKVYNTIGYFTDRVIQFTLQKHHDSEESMEGFLTETVNYDHKFTCSKPKQTTKNPPCPYTTSAIQQAASNEMHISPKDTMKILQTLYEGGYITYMRTDSTTYSKEFIETVKPFVTNKWGDKYLHDDVERLSLRSSDEDTTQGKKKKKKDKKDDNAQEAHEAIRPTNIETLSVDDSMHNREKKMYEMIWRNTLESCMSPALFNCITAKFTAPENTEYRCSEEDAIFLGWKIVKGMPKADGVSKYNFLLALKQNTVMDYKKITSKVTLKDLKTHYTEAKLVQLLEQKGIGRPSTFSSLVDKIQEREYVKKENVKGKKIRCVDFSLEQEELEETVNEREFGNEKNKLVLQPLGRIVIEFLTNNFNSLFEYEYTKNMEDELDLIAKGGKKGYELCERCYQEIDSLVKPLKGAEKVSIKIDSNHTYMIGKHGPVIKCVIDGKTTFKSVKKDVDLEKLKKGELTIEDVEQVTVIAGNILGKYEGNDMILRRGQYGLYVTWGTNTKSLASLDKKELDITLEDVVSFISKNTSIIRELTKDLSLRKGKFGDYVYYQTNKMKKPRFLKISEFKLDPKTCDKIKLIDWIKTTYKL